jgi:uncharacterized protein YdeI (YjbR/CyaY-like superfamily)
MPDPPVVAFADAAELRAWLEAQPLDSAGAWVRLVKTGFGIPSVTFLELLDAG